MEDPSSLFELQASLFELRPDKPPRQAAALGRWTKKGGNSKTRGRGANDGRWKTALLGGGKSLWLLEAKSGGRMTDDGGLKGVGQTDGRWTNKDGNRKTRGPKPVVRHPSSVSHRSPAGVFAYFLALKVNFWPPMATSYIKPPMVCTNTAMPL
jgi:hypothetical protein